MLDFCPKSDYNAFYPNSDDFLDTGDTMTDTEKFREYAAVLDQCDKELDEIYHQYAVSRGFSDAALWILYVLLESETVLTQTDICSCWFLSRQTVNTALKGLEKQGLIRLDCVGGNKKSKNVCLTEQGTVVAEKIVTPLCQAENRVFASMTEEENRLYMALSQKRCVLLRQFLEEDKRISV